MKTDKIYYGVAYYDEYMPYDRIEKDFQMMKAAGMNVIRIAESTWSTWEPKEGEFDFTSLHRMLDAAKKYDLSVIVGTPTYAIPAWLAKKEEDMLVLGHNGQEIYGHRQNMDITNPTYLKYAKRIIEKLMEEVKSEPHVIGFQLDNETKHYDTCGARAQKMFVEELKKEWPDIKAFNHEFGLDYWSNRVDDWDDFPDIRGTINQSLAAEYAKFQRNLVTKFLKMQADIVSKYKREDQFITQNFDFGWHDYSFGLQPEVNQWEAAKCMQVAGADIYHLCQDDLTGMEVTACGNIARGIKDENYLILETLAQGNATWLPYEGQLRLLAYSHIANGSNSVMYWHWHSIHNAIESYWKGVLSHDLAENATYRECKVIGNELKKVGDRIKNLKKQNKVAIMLDNASLTGLSLFPTNTNEERSYNIIFRWLGDSLTRLQIEYDIIPADATRISKYDCVIVPALYSATEELLAALVDYVKEGKSLIATFKTGFSDEHLKIYPDTQPHILHKALGIFYDQFTCSKDCFVSYNGKKGTAKEWMELVSCEEAISLANYEHKAWGKYAAITKNHFGKGSSLYLATMFDEEVIDEVLRDYLAQIGLYEKKMDYLQKENSPIMIKEGINDYGNRITYLLNYSSDTKEITNQYGEGMDLLTGNTYKELDHIMIEPWGVVILEG